MDKLESITRQMNVLEIDIAREQHYIDAHGEENDADSDEQWEQYKEAAAYHLEKWDMLKSKRDELKRLSTEPSQSL